MSRIENLNEVWDNRHIGDEIEFFLKQIISKCINDIDALNDRIFELQGLLSSVPKFDSVVVEQLPPVEEASPTTIYLLPEENYYDEYMVFDSGSSLIWKKIASSKPITGIPLSDLSREVQDAINNAVYIDVSNVDDDYIADSRLQSGEEDETININVNRLSRAVNGGLNGLGDNDVLVDSENGSSEFIRAVQGNLTDLSYQEQNCGAQLTDCASSMQEIIENKTVSIPKSVTYTKPHIPLENTSQKKPCICFQMDWGQYTAQSCQAYAEKLNQYGIDKSTYAIGLSRMTAEYDLAQATSLYENGNEIALHTDSSHANIGLESTLTIPQFNELMDTYHDEMSDIGFTDCTGCVVFRTALKEEFYDEIKKHFSWIVAGPANYNGDVDNNSYLSALMTASTNYQFIKRLSIELTPERAADRNFDYEQRIINNIKDAINLAIENNGFLVLYCHSYAVSDATYTLTDNVLTGILEYLRPLLEDGVCFTGNTSDLVEYYFSECAEE